MGRYHYGWFCFLTLDTFSKETAKTSRTAHFKSFENIFITSEEMDEIRNRINYLLEEEDDGNENPIDPDDETYFDPVVSADP